MLLNTSLGLVIWCALTMEKTDKVTQLAKICYDLIYKVLNMLADLQLSVINVFDCHNGNQKSLLQIIVNRQCVI